MKKIIVLISAVLFSATILFSAVDLKSLFEQGSEAFNTGNYSSAELLFRKLLDAGDDEYADRAWFYLACSIYHQKKYKSALYEFNSFLNKCRAASFCNEARYWMGETYFFLKDNTKAVEEYNRFIQNGKDHRLVPLAHDRRGMIYILQKRYDEAIIEWEAALAKSSDKEKNALRIMKIGEAFFNNKRYDDSMKRLNPLLTSNADIRTVSRARLIIGRIYQMQENHNYALIMLNAIPNNLLNDYPFQDAYYFKSLSLLKLGGAVQARTFLELFVNIGKESEWYYHALFQLGNMLIQSGEEKKGFDMLAEVRASARPELKAESSKILSRIFITRDPEKAIPYLMDSLANDDPEEQKEIMILLAKAYMSLKRFNEAGGVLDNFLAKYSFDKRSDEAKFLRGRVYLETENMDKAIALFDAIQKDNPFSKFVNEINFYQALVNYRKGNYPVALNLLKKYVTRNDVDFIYDANVLMVEIYLKTEDPKNTDAMAGLLMRNYPTAAGVENIIYRSAEFLNKKGFNAKPYFNFILNRFPESDTAMKIYYTLGNDYFSKKEFEKAVENYTKYLTGDKKENRSQVFYNRMASLYYLKKFDEFITVFEKEKIPPFDLIQLRELQAMLFRSYFSVGKFEKIYNLMYNDDLSNYHKSELLVYAVSALKVGDLETAKRVTGLLVGEKELYAESLFSLGKYYQENKKPDDAMGYYSRIITECPTALEFVDNAKIGISEVYIQKKRYQDAISKLSEIKIPRLQNKKNAMLIVSYFEAGENQKAVVSTETLLNQLLQANEGEIVMKYNLEYYYKEKNPQKFDQYWLFSLKYKNLNQYADFLNAKLSYETMNYNKAYNLFYKLTQQEGRFTDESLYRLGMISLFVYNNITNAKIFFSKVAESKSAEMKLKVKSRINCAILSKEMNKPADSKTFLDSVIAESDRGLPNSQAKNLYEAFGIGGNENK